MNVINPGHIYYLETYDNSIDRPEETLVFMKRIGSNYPYNEGNAFPGTNCQEVIRVLIDRVKYLDKQHHSEHNKRIIVYLRAALREFETRARARRNQPLIYWWELPTEIETISTCPYCGHILCLDHKGELE